MAGIGARVEKLERECGRVDGPCSVCEARAHLPPRAAIPGTREELIDIVTLDCWRCGRPFVLNIVCVESLRTGDEPSIQA